MFFPSVSANVFADGFSNVNCFITLTKIEQSELAVEPIRADSVIFLESAEIIPHIEFQTEPNQNIPFRMTDYRLRLDRKYPERKVHQVAIYLSHSRSHLVHETTFNLELALLANNQQITLGAIIIWGSSPQTIVA